MPSRGSYLLRLGGTLKGDPKANGTIIEEIRKFFEPRPKQGVASFNAKPGAPWPDGFVLKDYYVCAWDLKIEEENKETVISFRAEPHHILDGTLYANKHVMIPEVQWFYHSPEYKWHKDLKAKLQAWNKKIGPEKLICWIWFRDWQWYCGNGGS